MTISALYAANGGKPLFNQFITPVGKVVHCYHDQPQLETTDSKPPKPVMDENGIQKANYKITLAWDKALLKTELIAMRTMAALCRDQAWGTEAYLDAWLNLQPFLREGDNPEHNTANRDYLHGMVYLNFKQKANPTRQPDGRVAYSGKPGLTGPSKEALLPSDMYAGCMARCSGIMFGTEYSGRRFISTRLNNIQKATDGERIGGGGRPSANDQFDALEVAQGGGSPFGNIL